MKNLVTMNSKKVELNSNGVLVISGRDSRTAIKLSKESLEKLKTKMCLVFKRTKMQDGRSENDIMCGIMSEMTEQFICKCHHNSRKRMKNNVTGKVETGYEYSGNCFLLVRNNDYFVTIEVWTEVAEVVDEKYQVGLRNVESLYLDYDHINKMKSLIDDAIFEMF